MKKKILILFVIFLICCFSVSAAKVDNWKVGQITADFSVDKDGFNFKELNFSVLDQVNDYVHFCPGFKFSSEDETEDSGFFVKVSIKNTKNPKLGGIFRVLSQIEEYYKYTYLTLWFRNPEKGFRAIEFDVTSNLEIKDTEDKDKTIAKSDVGFLFSFAGDKSRTDFHFNGSLSLEKIYSTINFKGKLHYIDKAIKVDDFVSGIDVAILVDSDVSPKTYLHSGIDFEYSYDNAPQENGLYATVNLENHKVSEDFYFSVNAKAGAHVIDNAITFDVKKVGVSANFKSTIPMVLGEDKTHTLHFIPGFEYVNKYGNKDEDNGFFANLLIGGIYLDLYRNLSGVSVKLQHYDSIKDLNVKGLSENLFGLSDNNKKGF